MPNVENEETSDLIATYMHLTNKVLPNLARSGQRDWPVSENHCFQRIVLDAICGGVWYAHLDRPAYKHLTDDQARRAVELCRAIEEGRADLRELNQQSLVWRGKRRAPEAAKRTA
ncbi:MAG: hypothetical protein AAFY06_06520 [Pseudomonadota bacterium]